MLTPLVVLQRYMIMYDMLCGGSYVCPSGVPQGSVTGHLIVSKCYGGLTLMRVPTGGTTYG